jgi:hypothetical protein
MAQESKRTMTFDELKQSPEYAACSDKMKLWLQTLISSDFNYTLATVTAFQCKSTRQAAMFSYAVRNWAKVRAALNLYLGRNEQDVFLEDLAQTIRRAPKGSVAQVRAQALYARMKFGVSTPDNDEPTPARDQQTVTNKSEAPITSGEPTRFHVGQIITDRDENGVVHTGRVLSVDADGQFIDVEEI